MNKIVVLFLIIAVQLFRAFHKSALSSNSKHLYVSLFVISIPFQIYIPIHDIGLGTIGGALGNKIYLMFPFLLYLIFSIVVKKRKIIKSNDKYDNWVLLVLLMILITFLNPYNNTKMASLVFAIFFISHILLFNLFYRRLSQSQIIKGILDGLIVLSIVQFILAICYPVLNIVSVTNFIHSTGTEAATRMDTRPGAIGTFVHPGNLSLFIIITSSIFLAAYLKGYKKTLFKYLVLINTITLYLTFSRTSYLVYIFDLFLVFVVYKNAKKSLFTLRNVIKFVVPLTVFLVWLVFYSPLSESFLKGDSNDQIDNRFIHFFMALNAFELSPIIGVGLNTHVELFTKQSSLSNAITLDDFFTTNPIHNIHLIVLTETGLIGLLLWFFFIFKSYSKSKENLLKGKNEILNLSFIGTLTAFISYGLTGWAPFSQGILPFFLLISFFATKFNNSNLNISRIS